MIKYGIRYDVVLKKAVFASFALCLLAVGCKKKENDDEEEDQTQLALVYDEPFDNNKNNWWIGVDSIYSATISGGAYHLSIQKDSLQYWVSNSNAIFNTGNNFKIEAEIAAVNFSDQASYGLYWGFSGIRSGNYFFLDKYGNTTVGYISNFVSRPVIGWFSPGNIDVNGVTKLTVERAGSLVKYYINGILIGDEEYRSLTLRNFGFMLYGKSDVRIEHFRIYD